MRAFLLPWRVVGCECTVLREVVLLVLVFLLLVRDVGLRFDLGIGDLLQLRGDDRRTTEAPPHQRSRQGRIPEARQAPLKLSTVPLCLRKKASPF